MLPHLEAMLLSLSVNGPLRSEITTLTEEKFEKKILYFPFKKE